MNRFALILLAGVAAFGFTGCREKTMSEKVEDKAEDVSHETKQGVERAGEKVEDAAD